MLCEVALTLYSQHLDASGRVFPTRLVITWETGGVNWPKLLAINGEMLLPVVCHPSGFPSIGRTLSGVHKMQANTNSLPTEEAQADSEND